MALSKDFDPDSFLQEASSFLSSRQPSPVEDEEEEPPFDPDQFLTEVKQFNTPKSPASPDAELGKVRYSAELPELNDARELRSLEKTLANYADQIGAAGQGAIWEENLGEQESDIIRSVIGDVKYSGKDDTNFAQRLLGARPIEESQVSDLIAQSKAVTRDGPIADSPVFAALERYKQLKQTVSPDQLKDSEAVNWKNNTRPYAELSNGSIILRPEAFNSKEAFDGAVNTARKEGALDDREVSSLMAKWPEIEAGFNEAGLKAALPTQDFKNFKDLEENAGLSDEEVFKKYKTSQTWVDKLQYSGGVFAKSAVDSILYPVLGATVPTLNKLGEETGIDSLKQAGQSLSEFAVEAMLKPSYSDDTRGGFGGGVDSALQAFGQGAGQVVQALAMRRIFGSKLAGTSTVMLSGSLQTGLEGYLGVYESAIASGKTHEQANEEATRAFVANMPAGLLEAVPIDRVLSKIPRGLVGKAAKAIGSGLSEVATENIQNYANNLVNQAVSSTYMEQQGMGLEENVGMFAGMTALDVITGSVRGRISRSSFSRTMRPDSTVLAPEERSERNKLVDYIATDLSQSIDEYRKAYGDDISQDNIRKLFANAPGMANPNVADPAIDAFERILKADKKSKAEKDLRTAAEKAASAESPLVAEALNKAADKAKTEADDLLTSREILDELESEDDMDDTNEDGAPAGDDNVSGATGVISGDTTSTEARTEEQAAQPNPRDAEADNVTTPAPTVTTPTPARPLPTDALPTETPGATYGRETEVYDVFADTRRRPMAAELAPEVSPQQQTTTTPTPTNEGGEFNEEGQLRMRGQEGQGRGPEGLTPTPTDSGAGAEGDVATPPPIEAPAPLAKLQAKRNADPEEFDNSDPETQLSDLPANEAIDLLRQVGSTYEAPPVTEGETFGAYLERTGTSIFDFDTRPTVLNEQEQRYVPQGRDPFEGLVDLAAGRATPADFTATQAPTNEITPEEAERQRKAQETENFYKNANQAEQEDAAPERPQVTPQQIAQSPVKMAGDKGSVSGKALPVREVPTGEVDERGAPIVRVLPGFVNDSNTMAEVLDKNRGVEKIYVSAEEAANLDPEDIFVQYDENGAYVVAARHKKYGVVYANTGLTEDGVSLAELHEPTRQKNSQAQIQGKAAKRLAKQAGVSVDEVVIPEMTEKFSKRVSEAPISKQEQEKPQEVSNTIQRIQERAQALTGEAVTTDDGRVVTIDAELADRIGIAATNLYLARLRGVDRKGKFKDASGVVADIKKKVIPKLKKRAGTRSGVSLDQPVGDGSSTVGDLIGQGEQNIDSMGYADVPLDADVPGLENLATAEAGPQQDPNTQAAQADTPTPGPTTRSAPVTPAGPATIEEMPSYDDIAAQATSEAESELQAQDEKNGTKYLGVWKETLAMLRRGVKKKDLTPTRQRVVKEMEGKIRERMRDLISARTYKDEGGSATTKLSAESRRSQSAFTAEESQNLTATNLNKIIDWNGGTTQSSFDIKRVLAGIADDSKQPQLVRIFARFLANSNIDFSGVRFEPISDPRQEKDWLGLYFAGSTAKSGKIQINVGQVHRGGSISQTIVHEALHHVAFHKLRPSYKRTGIERDAYRDLTRILTHIRRQVLEPGPGQTLSQAARQMFSKGDDTFYGLANLDELFTETLTNTRFAVWMSTQAPLPELSLKNTNLFRNLYEQVKQLFKNLIGGQNVRPDSLLSQAMDNILALAQDPQDDAKIRDYQQRAPQEAKKVAASKSKKSQAKSEADQIKLNHAYWVTRNGTVVDVEEDGWNEDGTAYSHGRYVKNWIAFRLDRFHPDKEEVTIARIMRARAKELLRENPSVERELTEDGEPNPFAGDLAYNQAAQEQGWVRIKPGSSPTKKTIYAESRGEPSAAAKQIFDDLKELKNYEVINLRGGAIEERTSYNRPTNIMFFRSLEDQAPGYMAYGGSPSDVQNPRTAAVDMMVQEEIPALGGTTVRSANLNGHPAQARFNENGQPEIVYDPLAIATEVEGLDDSEARTVIRKLLGHEQAHVAGLINDYGTADAQGRTGREKIEAFHDEVMTPEMRQDVADSYVRRLDGMTDEDYAQAKAEFLADKAAVVGEFKRMFLERHLTGESYEDSLAALERKTGNKFGDLVRAIADYIVGRIRMLQTRFEMTKDPRLAAEILADRRMLENLNTGTNGLVGDRVAGVQEGTPLNASRAQIRRMKKDSAGWKSSGWFGQGLMDMRVFKRETQRDSEIRAANYRVTETARRFNRQVKQSGVNAQVLRDALGTTENRLTDPQYDQFKKMQRAAKRETDPVKRQAAQQAADQFRIAQVRTNNQTNRAKRQAALAQLPADLRDTVLEMRKHIDGFTKTIVSKGMVGSDLQATLGDNLEVYLNRSYEIFDNPEWSDFILTDQSPESIVIRNDAQRLFRSQLVAEEARRIRRNAKMANQPVPTRQQALAAAQATVTQNDVDTMMQDYLRTGDSPSVAILGGRVPGKKDMSIMKLRGQIPKEIRALWGEYKDPEVNYARTYMNMARFVAEHSFQQDFLDMGLNSPTPFLWKEGVSTTPKPPHWVPVYPGLSDSPNPNPMAGVYGPEIIGQAFKDMDVQIKHPMVNEWLMGLTGFSMAAKTVYNVPQSNVRNFLGNGLLMFAQGYLGADITKLGFLNRIATSAKVTGPQTIGLRPERNAAVTDYVERLIGLGVMGDNVKANVVKELTSVVFDRNPAKAFGEKAAMAWKFVKGANERVTDAYQAADDFWKIVAFESERSLMERAYPNATPESLDRMAADRVRDVVPTYSMIPKIVQDLVKKQPYFAPFISWTSEIIRTTANTYRIGWQDATSGNPALQASGIWRLGLATTAFVILGAVASTVREMMGIPEEDEERLRRFLPEWQVNALLMVTGKKEDGKISFWDLSYLNPYNVLQEPFIAVSRELASGSGALSAAAAGAQKLLDPWTGEQLLFGAIMDVSRGVTVDGNPLYEKADTEWNKTKARLNRIASALTPGSINISNRIYKAFTGTIERSGRSYDLSNELIGPIIGQRLTENDPMQSFQIGKIPKFKGMMQSAANLATREFRTRGTPDLTKIRENYVQSNDARMKAFSEIKKDVDALIGLGVPESKVWGALAAAELSKDDLRQIQAGIYVQRTPSNDTLDNAVGTPDYQKKLQAMREAIAGYPETQTLIDPE